MLATKDPATVSKSNEKADQVLNLYAPYAKENIQIRYALSDAFIDYVGLYSKRQHRENPALRLANNIFSDLLAQNIERHDAAKLVVEIGTSAGLYFSDHPGGNIETDPIFPPEIEELAKQRKNFIKRAELEAEFRNAFVDSTKSILAEHALESSYNQEKVGEAVYNAHVQYAFCFDYQRTAPEELKEGIKKRQKNIIGGVSSKGKKMLKVADEVTGEAATKFIDQVHREIISELNQIFPTQEAEEIANKIAVLTREKFEATHKGEKPLVLPGGHAALEIDRRASPDSSRQR